MAVDFGVHSPLIDLFLRGDVGDDARLLAASGRMPLPALEQVVLIALMSNGPDPAVALIADEAMSSLPAEGVARLLARPDTPAALKAWLLARGFVPGEPSAVGEAPMDGFFLGDDQGVGGQERHNVPRVDGAAPSSSDDEGHVTQLASLSIPARIKLAMLGSREQRAVLIRDPNRIVSSAVLSSPKVSDTEVENFARMSNVSAEVLRVIGTNRAWTRNYGVVAALVRNPRTPPALSLGLVPRLLERDVKILSTDRNVPEVLRLSARKMMAAKESRRQ